MTTRRRRLGRSRAASVSVLRGGSDRFIQPVARVPSFGQRFGQLICGRHHFAVQIGPALRPALGLSPFLPNPAQQHRVGSHIEFAAARSSALTTTRGVT
jgi:hypothetical protein